MHYTIRSDQMRFDDDGKAKWFYWTNVDGWSPNLSQASIFSDEERPLVSLPYTGEWIEVNVALAKP